MRRRRLFAATAIAALCAAAAPVLTFTQIGSYGDGSTTATYIGSASVGASAGDLVVAICNNTGSATVNSFSITAGTGSTITFTAATASTTANGQHRVYYAVLGVGESISAGDTFSTTNSASGGNKATFVFKVASTTGWKASPVDTISTMTTGTSSGVISGIASSALSQNYEALIFWIGIAAGQADSYTADADVTTIGSATAGANSFISRVSRVATTSTATIANTPNLGTSRAWGMGAISFKPN